MASFIRHIGRHGDRKVAIIFREVPGEPHMCLVTYTELLNQNIHDPMIKCIESDIGQHSENLAEALNRSYTKDGNIILHVLHREGQLKKVQTEQIVVTPAPNTKIKLSELNAMLDEMEKGEEAIKKLAEWDKSMGLQDPREVAKRMRNNALPTVPTGIPNSPDALGDALLAKQRLEQAQRMEREANGLLAEAKRLKDEAATLDPKLNKPPVVSEPVASVAPATTKTVKTNRPGRPRKVAA